MTEPPKKELQKPCLLVAEDNDDMRGLVQTILENEGFEVDAYPDGASAFTAAAHRVYDLAVIDVAMPGMDGFELVRRLRSMTEYADTPIVMLTGAGTSDDIVRGFELGVSDYVVKPFNKAVFITRVRRLLKGDRDL